ncbi:MAG TPA: ribosome-associated translation inhibitor RaiA [Mycobacterium sp.]|uniref:ribosome hibernation-promoting factor, HPF/YfiA family n=1 Tax=Mycobacterium sp. TaxID=1785 RepID=UPI002D62B128|nr:ribosome-associated translation inhibitor RaiA [Mycobacterium sp.]HZU48396.1 ribosome-associated translation inhibitor RaiA [Mycobacterium sp.]
MDSGQLLADTDEQAEPTPRAEVVVKSRNVEIPDHYRVYVSQKLARLERLDRSIYLFDVELKHAPNRRQRKSCQRVEITARGRGPVKRAEACANSFYAAFETAVDKLENRLRRVKDRRKVHYGDKTPVALCDVAAAAPAPKTAAAPEAAFNDDEAAFNPEETASHTHDAPVTDHEPGQIVRVKEHPAKPMSVDDALYEMELVGHDFFLFHDKETDKPSVVYRRRGYDYGLIRLA